MNPAVPPDPNRVEIRCEDCARDLGPAAPTLVVCSFQTGNWAVGSGLRDHWELIGLGQRRPARAARAVTSGISSRTFDQNTLRGRAVELACRRCKRRGWRRRRKLYAVAEQARAVDTSDAYLSLG
jgi:hypothetical protein